MSNVILRLPVVKARTGLSRSTIYLRVSTGSFPAPISLGGRAVGWIEKEVDEWVFKQIEAARQLTGLTCSANVGGRLQKIEHEAGQ